MVNAFRVVVVVVEGGGAEGDGRTRHGRMESMEWKRKITAEMNFMFESFGLSRTVLSHPSFAASIHHMCVLQQCKERGFV